MALLISSILKPTDAPVCHHMFCLFSFYNPEKLTFNLQREVLNVVHIRSFKTRELQFVNFQVKIHFKHL